MKRLTITYNTQVLFDGDVADFRWHDTDTGVEVSGSTAPAPKPASLADVLRKAKTVPAAGPNGALT